MNRTTPLAVLAISLMTVAGCSGSSKKKASPTAGATSSSATSTTTSVSPRPSVTPAAPRVTVNPLTGQVAVAGPVIAVKIDDTRPGRPQLNIDKADVVYVEEVEAGLSRLLAIYDTHKPVVGYVRSIRLADPELLLQYGKITLAASGGSTPSLRNLTASGLPHWINDAGNPYFKRDTTRASDYINLTLDLAAVSKVVKTAAARNVGFTWKANPVGLAALPKVTYVAANVGSQTVSFTYDAKTQRYIRKIHGEKQLAVDGKYVSTPNVIYQECTITAAAAKDVNGRPQQITHSIGSGVVHIFRNGHEYTGTWSRKTVASPTIFRDAKGVQIPLAPGGAWIALVRPHTPITL